VVVTQVLKLSSVDKGISGVSKVHVSGQENGPSFADTSPTSLLSTSSLECVVTTSNDFTVHEQGLMRCDHESKPYVMECQNCLR
jgi:hypothetical protein